MEVKVYSAKQLGKICSSVRKSQGLDQETAGSFSGSSRNTIYGFETGTGNMSIERVFTLMEALGIEFKVDIPLPEFNDKKREELINKITRIT
ncbi:Cro/CI family transcriptional regulator-related protein [Catenovulum agarivorans DS-2]|uniref:Cro/CI family transcriptional regulator-related protein n=1 Tax=Catenovulum agarivorans DS-2 TaxID=1328313 RepID=W7QPK3_9ALTE|nr:helix-turn-helix transcriptional regulator [Catenovulum agarivorans]EWH09813.1 Cro/CI family transcriptional regulator-related protein [Catenovulum agarivorans DS-2]